MAETVGTGSAVVAAERAEAEGFAERLPNLSSGYVEIHPRFYRSFPLRFSENGTMILFGGRRHQMLVRQERPGGPLFIRFPEFKIPKIDLDGRAIKVNREGELEVPPGGHLDLTMDHNRAKDKLAEAVMFYIPMKTGPEEMDTVGADLLLPVTNSFIDVPHDGSGYFGSSEPYLTLWNHQKLGDLDDRVEPGPEIEPSVFGAVAVPKSALRLSSIPLLRLYQEAAIFEPGKPGGNDAISVASSAEERIAAPEMIAAAEGAATDKKAAEEERKPPETRFSENSRRVRELKDKGGKEMNLTKQELMELTNLFSETMAALAEMFEKGISLKMGGKSLTAMELFRMVNADRVAFEKKLFGS